MREAPVKRVRSFGSFDDLRVPDIDVDSNDSIGGASSEGDGENSSGGSSVGGYVQDVSAFDRILLASWEDRFAAGLFRYDVTAVKTKVVPGKYGFVAQFNEGRATKKRPTEFSVDKVCQDFDGSKFNFAKATSRRFSSASNRGSARCDPASTTPRFPWRMTPRSCSSTSARSSTDTFCCARG